MEQIGAVNLVETFVFLDLETTGFEDPNITELAMWVTPRENLIAGINAAKRPQLNKWTMLFNPGKTIEPMAREITGLDNDMLAKYNKFDQDVAMSIMLYLYHYPKPICLIAHNGKRYDFPIIKRSFEKVDLSIPDYIVCSDSLAIFKDLENRNATAKHFKEVNGNIANTQRKSFKLCDVYKRLFNSEPAVAHFAEADVETLYKIALFYGDGFIKSAEKLAFTFSNIKGNASS